MEAVQSSFRASVGRTELLSPTGVGTYRVMLSRIGIGSFRRGRLQPASMTFEYIEDELRFFEGTVLHDFARFASAAAIMFLSAPNYSQTLAPGHQRSGWLSQDARPELEFQVHACCGGSAVPRWLSNVCSSHITDPECAFTLTFPLFVRSTRLLSSIASTMETAFSA
jgi:hypothetical protein